MRLLLTLLTVVGLLGCGGGECRFVYIAPNVQDQNVLQNNTNAIENYLDQNGLIANKTATGLYYIIATEGDMKKPDLCDNVFISYSGYFFNGDVFDSSPGVSFPLTNLIPAWQEGIPLFGKGGKGTLITPSYLAYGSQGAGNVIPPNTVLLFDIELLDF